jgi:hypothetical protein
MRSWGLRQSLLACSTPGTREWVGVAEPHLWRQGEVVKKSSIVKVATFATPISQ